jgi:hypothetical protein
MYDEGADGGAGPAPALAGAVKRFNLEGLIPLILLVIIGVASLNYFGIIDVPYLPKGSPRVQIMFIGEPSIGEKIALDNLAYFVTYRTRDASTFSLASSEEFSQYDIVILDQTNISDKSVNVSLGEAIQKYVQKGGKLIIVMNSGVYQSVGFNGYTASDAVDWRATLGKIVPARCVAAYDGVPTCAAGREVPIVGRIRAQDYDHPIMQGVEVAPTMDQPPIALSTLDIAPDEGAKRIAYVQAENTPKAYEAILEKKSFPMGTVIYFNYDPGLTQTVFKNTIMYLK